MFWFFMLGLLATALDFCDWNFDYMNCDFVFELLGYVLWFFVLGLLSTCFGFL